MTMVPPYWSAAYASNQQRGITRFASKRFAWMPEKLDKENKYIWLQSLWQINEYYDDVISNVYYCSSAYKTLLDI